MANEDLKTPYTRDEEFLAKTAGETDTAPTNQFSRLELYLAKMAGEDVTVPSDTRSRLERYLKEIAENGGGGTPAGLVPENIKYGVTIGDVTGTCVYVYEAYPEGDTWNFSKMVLVTGKGSGEVDGESNIRVELLGAYLDNHDTTSTNIFDGGGTLKILNGSHVGKYSCYLTFDVYGGVTNIEKILISENSTSTVVDVDITLSQDVTAFQFYGRRI